jgi:hypothetical protein
MENPGGKILFSRPLWSLSLFLGLCLASYPRAVKALPPADDLPEEKLRTEIILEGRSPLDGQPLSASQYEELKKQLAERPYPPQVAPKIRQLVFLLRVRKFFRTIFPFL